ncbi:MAG: hypothetical protein V3V97_08290, partial [Hyphomicrobiaceae bacterium]
WLRKHFASAKVPFPVILLLIDRGERSKMSSFGLQTTEGFDIDPSACLNLNWVPNSCKIKGMERFTLLFQEGR